MGMMKPLAAALAMAAAGVAAGVGADAMMRGPERAGDAAAAVAIDGLRLAIPADYLRPGARAGAAERVDLVLRHPGMLPAGAPRLPKGATPREPRELVFVAIERADGGIDPAERAQDLYGRFLEPDAWRNPGGLLLRRFQAGSPYEDEEIYIAPPDGRAFTARCRKPGKATEAIGESCLWRVRREGADIQVRFAPELLPHWETLTAGVAARIDSWASPGARP